MMKSYNNPTGFTAEFGGIYKNKTRTTISVSRQKSNYIAVSIALMLFMSTFFGNLAILWIGMIGVFLTLICAEGLPQRFYGYMAIVSVLMMIYLLVHYYGLIEQYGIPYYAGDDEHFEGWMEYLYDQGIFTISGLKNVVFTNQYNARGYPLFMAWLKLLSIGYYHTAMPRVLNLYFWLSISILSLKMVKARINDAKIEKCMFFSLALFPNGLFISSFVYRDTLMEFLIIAIVYNLRELIGRSNRGRTRYHKPLCIFIIGLFGFYLAYIRFTAIYICIMIGILVFLEKRKEISVSNRLVLYLAFAAAGIVMVWQSNMFDLLNRYSTNYTNYLLSQEYGLSSRIFSMKLFPYGWLFRALYGLTVPFPAGLISLEYLSKPLFSLSNAIVYLGTFYQIVLLPYLVRGVLKRNVNAWMYLVVYASVVFTTFTFRHFITPVPFFAITVAEEYMKTSGGKRIYYLGMMIVALLGMAMLYFFLKAI